MGGPGRRDPAQGGPAEGGLREGVWGREGFGGGKKKKEKSKTNTRALAPTPKKNETDILGERGWEGGRGGERRPPAYLSVSAGALPSSLPKNPKLTCFGGGGEAPYVCQFWGPGPGTEFFFWER